MRAGRPQHGEKPRDPKEGLEGAREEAKSPERRAGRRCGLAARSTGRSQESGKKGWKEVRAGRPQHGKKPRVRKEGLEGGTGWPPAAREEAKSPERRAGTRCGLAARSTGRSQETRKKGWKEVRAGRPQHGKKPRDPKEGLEGGAGWPPAAREEAKSPERRVGRRRGQAARTGRSQETQKKSWKEVRAGRPQHGKKQVPKEGLEGGVGWTPAAREEAKSPERRAGRRCGLDTCSTPQHGKKPRVPKEGLEGGAGWPPAAREEAKSPEKRAGRGRGLAARSTERSTGRSQESGKKGWKEVRAGSPQHGKKVRKEGLEGGRRCGLEVGRRCGLAARSTGRSQESGKKGWKEVRAGSPQHGKKPRVRKEGLEGGAGWHPAAREEAKSPERRVGRRRGLAARSTGRSQESGKKGWKEVRAGSPQHGKKVWKEGL